jgi:hypothetical protein
MAHFHDNALVGASGQQGYQISRSLRFNSADSAYLNRTPASAGNRKTYTISMWVKRAKLGATARLFGAYSSGSAYFEVAFTSSDTLQWYYWNGSGYSYNRVTTQVFRDPSAWCHLVFVFNSPAATASQRIRIYFNGQEITTFSSSTDPTLNFDCLWNSTSTNVIADLLYAGSPGSTFDGMMTEIHHIDGQALTPSSFGETDTITGVWKPKKYTGTYGTNGFYLNFSRNSLSTNLTSTATITAPFGGTAENARLTDSVYLTSNTTTGSTFTLVQEDFGSVVPLTRYSIASLYFTGGLSTFELQYSSNGSSWTTASAFSITGTAQSINGTLNILARYVRIQATAFGTNGQGNIDSLIVYQDELGYDSSGNNNNWVPNNFSVTAGAGNDSLIDTPTPYADGGNGRGNYCTWNPLDKSSQVTLTNGNLNATATVADWRSVNGTVGMSSGKWYWEVTVTGTVYHMIGISKAGINLGQWVGYDANGWGYYAQSGTYNNSSYINTSTFASYTSGDVIGVAFDASAGSLYFYKNGTAQNSGNAAYTGLTSGPYFPAISHFSSTNSDANFGQRPFAYTPPSGFVALNTQNLPEPSIKKPSSYMDVKLYTGTGASHSITGLGFSPDLVWTKARSSAESHRIYDTARGATLSLFSNLTNAESTESQSLTAFNSDGFTLGTGAPNTSSVTYVAWCWDESATPGFDIVTYTGNSTAGRTVAHSLGVAPSMIITKSKNTNLGNWAVYHSELGNTKALYLNQTVAAFTGSNWWNNTSPTSSVFTVGTSNDVNGASDYVAYLWSEVAGFSKFGSYTGNGSSDGPFLHCGFRPAFVIFKSSSSGYDWFMFDNRRDPENVVDLALFPNSSSAESGGSTYMFDFTSNGIKIRNSQLNLNGSGNTYIFCAWAETPAKYSLAR